MTVNKFVTPCELIINVGANEHDEISIAISSLLRTCSINEQKCVVVEKQIQSTSFFGTFTAAASIARPPIQCQSLSCVILLSDDQRVTTRDCFKSNNLWNFHHKIELLNEYKQVIARQDYYELSHLLPLWSVTRVPNNRHSIVRFNVFTNHFETMVTFYTRLFQRSPNSSKSGFVLFVLPSKTSLVYQLSIKYSTSIQSYTISQAAHLKLRLDNLNGVLHDYSSKLFTINPSEYYIYDPDGNLLHIQLCQLSLRSTRKEAALLKRPFAIHDSGIGDTSEASMQILSPRRTIQQAHHVPNHPDLDNQSHSSNDSGGWSSLSSNELKSHAGIAHYRTNPTLPSVSIPSHQSFFCRSPITTHRPFHGSHRPHPPKPSMYDSVPCLSYFKQVDNRNYSSLSDVQRVQHDIRPRSTHHFRSKTIQNEASDYDDLSYDVDAAPASHHDLLNTPSHGYLHAFLERKRHKQDQKLGKVNVKQLIAKFEQPRATSNGVRPLSAPTIDPRSKSAPSQSLYNSLIPKISCPVTPKSKSPLMDYESEEEAVEALSSHDEHIDDDNAFNGTFDFERSPRINIGITLDSRLRKTPVLDMLRSTKMESPRTNSSLLNRSHSLRSPSISVARF